MHRISRISLASLLLLFVSLPGHAHHWSFEAGQQQGVRYLNGGIGREEVAQIKTAAASQPFTLAITLVSSDKHAFRTAVPLTIHDSAGRRVFSLDSAGPLVYVNLPAGQYTVRVDDPPASRKVSLRQGSRRAITIQSNVPDH